MSAALRAYADREAQQQAEAAANPNDVPTPLVGKRVVISGLLARPDLNGAVGYAVSFSSANGRYTVNVNDEQIALKSTNLSEKKTTDAEATMFTSHTRVRIKGLAAKPELNECGATVVEWNAEKERYVIQLDGSLKNMLVRAANLERDKRERWQPEMHTVANLAHIQAETERYYAEQAKNANPFAAMDPTGEIFKNGNNEPKQEEAA